jgi:RluA family pseudouridine synthase
MSAPAVIKLSSPATREFWEIPVLFEEAHLLALDKPAGLPVSPEGDAPERPSLTALLHAGIAAGKPWAQARGLTYLMHGHRLESEASGVILFARSQPVRDALANFFGADNPGLRFLALARGAPAEDRFEINTPLAPHPVTPGLMRVDPKHGKRSRTVFAVRERFSRHTLLCCTPWTPRAHQIRAHLRQAGLRLVGDALYGGQPLWLSRLKREYRLKEGKTERPLLARPALHAEALTLPHPVSGETLTITSPWPKDLTVAVKYLRRYAGKAGERE